MNSLWTEWFSAVSSLRQACTRGRTFAWMVVVLVGFSIRSDSAGVTSFVRAALLFPGLYHSLLHLFHSEALRLDWLTSLWVQLVLRIFVPFRSMGRLVFLADGLKVPKEGRKMPAVKKLHQVSDNNSKPPFIMGHSFQAISILVTGRKGLIAAIPLISRIHEGLVWHHSDHRTLLDKMVAMFLEIVSTPLVGPAILVADAYYASQKIIKPLLALGHHLVTKVRSTAVAFYPAPIPTNPAKGRPKLYGKKVRLSDLTRSDQGFVTAPSPISDDSGCIVFYRSLDLLWRPVGRLVRFVLVKHPNRGTLVLMSTDTSLHPMEILKLYSLRFNIETGFRQAIHVVGSYAYHFWMKLMTPIYRKTGDQYVQIKSVTYKRAVRRKLDAYHRYVQLGCIAQGLLLHLAINFGPTVWAQFNTWLRTMKTDRPPSELVVTYVLRSRLLYFLLATPKNHELLEILAPRIDPTRLDLERLVV